jgi:NADPH:quinone reductase-like Zn-dependent oxidoreductase
VAILALQLAKAMGASVILTSSSDEKLTRARALGADQTLNYRSVPEWAAEVLKLTSGRGVDHVLELGGAGTLTGTKGEVPTGAMMRKQIRLQGLIWRQPSATKNPTITSVRSAWSSEVEHRAATAATC